MSKSANNRNDHGLKAVAGAMRSAFVILRIVVVLLALAFCLSGARNLEQYENAVILRFGAMSGTVKSEPGLVLALPYPIDELIRIPARRLHTVVSDTFWYALTDAERAGGPATIPATLTPGVGGMLITRDQSIVHAKATLTYRISDPVRYTFRFAEHDTLLQANVDNALIKAVSTFTLSDLLKDSNRVTATVETVLRQRLSQLDIGVDIDTVDLQLDWPRQLANDINAVNQAEQARHERLAAARQYANEQENQVASETARVIAEAQAWATGETSRIVADAQTFAELYPLYQQNPEIMRRTLYEDRMKTILQQVDEVFVVENSDQRELRLRLERRQARKKRTQQLGARSD